MIISAQTKTTVQEVTVELNNNEIDGDLVDISLAFIPNLGGHNVIRMSLSGEGITGRYQITAQDLYDLALSKTKTQG